MFNDQNKRTYDLESRTLEFSKDVLKLVSEIPQSTILKPVLSQLIRSATSIGANCSEADEASSKKDFVNKINISKKEARETRYWLKLVTHILPNKEDKISKLLKEAEELNLILAAIVRNTKV